MALAMAVDPTVVVLFATDVAEPTFVWLNPLS